jgi:hypothetical protein
MKKNERWMKIIQRSKKKTHRSMNFHQVLERSMSALSRPDRAPPFTIDVHQSGGDFAALGRASWSAE